MLCTFCRRNAWRGNSSDSAYCNQLLDKDVDELTDWCNANFRERVRREYKAKHPKAKKPDIKKLRYLAVAAEVAIRDLASALSSVDCFALGGWLRLGKKLTEAMRDGSSVPTKYASELAATKRDIANATYPP